MFCAPQTAFNPIRTATPQRPSRLGPAEIFTGRHESRAANLTMELRRRGRSFRTLPLDAHPLLLDALSRQKQLARKTSPSPALLFLHQLLCLFHNMCNADSQLL